MILGNLEEYTKDNKIWLCGDFYPAFFKTKDFEFGIHIHQAGEVGKTHYHRFTKEINIIMSGYIIINGRHLKAGDMFILSEFEVSESRFIEETTLLVLRNKSLPGDKVEFRS